MSAKSDAVGSDAAALAAQAGDLVDRLAAWPDASGFQELLALSERVGVALGTAARTLAAQGSWTEVAREAGTTKQAAWSRWH